MVYIGDFKMLNLFVGVMGFATCSTSVAVFLRKLSNYRTDKIINACAKEIHDNINVDHLPKYNWRQYTIDTYGNGPSNVDEMIEKLQSDQKWVAELAAKRNNTSC